MKLLKSILCLTAALSVSACYGYRTVQTAQPGMEVRARLKGESAAKRSEGLDEPIVRYEGVVVAAAPESLSLDVLIARSSSAFQDVVIRDTVLLNISEIQSLQRRTLSVPRTVLFSIAAGAAAVGVIAGLKEVVGGTGDSDKPGNQTFTMPLFSWQMLRVLVAGSGHR